ncbi:dicarboxylate/amino acid:cation symporter [Staphylococcus equorum]|uniref:dicarboxylate/amino acid:cation symporter n=1 Tax=Staphylococcus equorum TaxID=246432 RepID=UPI00080616C5|nr:dicarboxylate/amino acid:cation symporter [Staphylococcus equorum]ANQ65687.1 sodium:dicarboxylate symporter [Staphylococcus equorum]
MWKNYKNSSIVLKMTIAFISGLIIALILGENAKFLEPLGQILIRLLNLIAIPIIFLTIVLSVSRINLATLGRMGGKLFLYYSITTGLSVFIGVIIALIINPGENLTLPKTSIDKPSIPSFSDILYKIIPDNLIKTFSSDELLSILFIAIILGISMSILLSSSDKNTQQKTESLQSLFEILNKLFNIILNGILLYAPIGVFGISASTFGSQGLNSFKSLLLFTLTFYIGIFILWLLVYFSFLKLANKPVWKFLKDTKEAYLTAFFTSSSIASLPISIKSAKKANISNEVINFSIPLGTIFNSDGGALRMGVSIVFATNVTGINLSLENLFMIVIIGTVLSIGTAGIPAGGLITLSAVLSLFGLPLEIVALIAGVDAIIGMGGTASNVLGDIIGAAVIDKKNKGYN